jgi:hypothetical protein
MPPEKSRQTVEATEDWLLVQSAVGESLRISMAEITEERLPGCFAMLLLRLAFAQFIHDLAREEAGAAIRDEAPC